MAEFTPLSSWQHLQDTKAANEIVQAYNERRQCVGDSAIDLLDAGSNAQDTAFWRGMQEWINTQVNLSGEPAFEFSRWLDHEETINGASEFPVYTREVFKTRTGLTGGDANTVGFRRATEYDPDVNNWMDYNDPMYSYGTIQSDDIRGPWIFEDLQKAFDMMRWTARERTEYIDPQNKTASTPNVFESTLETKQEAIDEIASLWESTEWEDGISIYFDTAYVVNYRVASGTNLFGQTRWTGGASRQRAKSKIENLPTHIKHEAECYLDVVLPTGANRERNEVDGFTACYYLLDDNFPLDNTSTRTSGYHDFDSLPKPPVAIEDGIFYELRDDFSLFVLKWQFSHTLPEPE
jgi:hypothetical protein